MLYKNHTFKQVGLKGEAMYLTSPEGVSSVEWIQGSLATQSRQSMTWYKVEKLKGPEIGII